MQAGADDAGVLTPMWEQLVRESPQLARALGGRRPWRARLRRVALETLESCGRAYSAHHMIAFC